MLYFNLFFKLKYGKWNTYVVAKSYNKVTFGVDSGNSFVSHVSTFDDLCIKKTS